MKFIDKYYKKIRAFWDTYQRILRWSGWLKVSVLVILFFSVALWMSRTYLIDGFPYTHDGENHLARFVNYASAIREGQIPPRFAPYIQSGFGFPVFHYNYPLANILTTPLIWFGLHPGKAFAMVTVFSAFLGVLSFYGVLRFFFSQKASMFGVGWYIFGAYWASAVVFRGSIGEILMYGLVPFWIWVWLQFFKNAKRIRWGVTAVFVTASVFLAHNVLALLIIPIVGLWSLSLAYERQKIRAWFFIWLSGVGLVSWFWFPAVLELSLVVLQQDSLATSAIDHLLSWDQIWFSPLRFGFSRITLLDTLGFGFGWGSFVVTMFAFSRFVCQGFLTVVEGKQVRFTHALHTTLLLGGMGLGALFLSSNSSSFIWELFPALSIIQFPWRFHFLFALLLPLLTAFVWESFKSGKWFLFFLLCVQIGWVSSLKPVDVRHTGAEYYLTFPHSTTTRNENRPVTLTKTELSDWAPTPQIATGEAVVSVQKWLGNTRSYEITAQSDILVVEPTIYFPGWRTLVDGEKVEYVLSDDFSKGLLAYELPKKPDQPYQIQTAFVERTPIRFMSEVATLFTVISMAIFIWWKRRIW